MNIPLWLLYFIESVTVIILVLWLASSYLWVRDYRKMMKDFDKHKAEIGKKRSIYVHNASRARDDSAIE